MNRAQDSPFAGRRVLVVGSDDRATALATALGRDGIDATLAESAPEAIATLDAVDLDLLVVVDGAAGRPTDVFGAAARRGHHLPGVFVGSKTRALPPGVEQAPAGADAAASVVRQRLLVAAADDADPAVEDNLLSTYGRTVSHELRNHLNAARLAIDSLEGPTLGQAREALDRLAVLADEAETVATGEVDATESVSLSDAGAGAVDRVRAPAASIHVDAKGTVEADRGLLTLLLENLIRNAVEHGSTSNQTASGDAAEHGAEDGDVTIRVVDTDAGFAVVDDGPGFGDENPFAWGYTTGDGQGSGLAIVERIADAHGWEIVAGGEEGARVEIRT